MMLQILLVSLLMLFPGARAAQAAAGVAQIEPTGPETAVSGIVYLEETPEGLEISAEVSNAGPGKHGFHIHENGSCEEGGKAAGGHFNPDGHEHGDLMKSGIGKTHAGDLGNIEVNEKGEGYLGGVFPGLTLTEGPYAVGGKAMILHAQEDDFGQPAGNAGGRIGCGVIEVLMNEEAYAREAEAISVP